MPQDPLRAFKADFFKALANPLRIHILDALRDREHSVGELRDLLHVETPNVSQQLAVLRAKGIVSARKEGNNVYYSVKDPMLFTLLDVAKAIFNNHLIGVQDMLQQLSEK
ncbi:MAG TPA: metalloregulator ArsR/SmtB family transcription factor [Oscillatoriaceae cyanobacterium]